MAGETDIQMTASELARVFGVNVDRIYRLTRDGVLQSRKVPGRTAKRYSLQSSAKAYIQFMYRELDHCAVFEGILY